MALSKPDNLISTVTTVLKEKEALASRERDLVRGLNKVLKKMGYEVVTIDQVSGWEKKKHRKRKRRGSTLIGRPPGRPATRRSVKKT